MTKIAIVTTVQSICLRTCRKVFYQSCSTGVGLGNETYADGVDIQPSEFYER